MANNISKITLPDKTTYNLKDSTAIHTGDAIVTGVKGSNETNYRTGQVNLTKDNVGLGNVGNFKAVSTVASQGLTDTEKSNARTNIGAGTSSFDGVYSSLSGKPTLGTAAAKDVASSGNASSAQVVMGNDTRLTNSRPASDVYSWAKASSKPTYTASEVGAIASSLKGAANGVAQLDANGLVPTSQLPTYVDDVLEYTAKADFPSTGETGKIYVDKTTNLTYRWSGTAYIEISPSLALGTTSSTAFRGDYGNTAYTHAVTNKGSAFSSGLYKITTNSEGHVTTATAVAKSDITGLGIPSQDTTYSDATTSTHGLMSTSDKTKLNGIANGAEVNQNAFSNIKVGSTTIAADGKTDTLEIAGSNVTITPDDTNDKVTIGITKTNVTSALGYTPPTTNTTYENATTDAAGLMSADDKSKLDGIAAGAQVNTVTSVAGKTGVVTLAKGDVGLGNVENKSSATIRGELTKANVTTALGYTPPTTDTTYSNATTSAAGLMSSDDKSKLNGIASGAEVNQNAFSNVKIGSTTVAADGKTDTLELAGSNVTLTPDATNDKITIGITKANVTTALGYTPPTTNTTYSVATTSADGLMSSTDKSKLNGIEEGAQVNSVTSVAGKTGAVTLSNSDVGLGNVGNFKAVSTVASQGLTDTEKSNARANIGAGTSSFNGAYSSLSGKPTLGTAAAKDVPSSGNASSTQVVLGNDSRLTNSRPASDVSSWAKASSKPTYTASEVGAIASTLKGAANGVAELDANGLVPSSQLPSYVDDVLEYTAKSSFPSTGETGKIYVDTTTNLTYRWSGSAYVEISPSLALGTTSSTAYRGDYGNTAYSHATDSSRLTTAKSSGLYKIATTAQGHVASVTAVAKSDITGLGIPGQDTTYSSKSAASGGTDVSLVTTGEKYTWNSKTSNTGTVTKVSTGVGLTGGDITTTGTIKAKLRSETALTNDSAAATETSGRIYPVVQDKSGYLAVNVPWTDNNTTYSDATTSTHGLMSTSDKTKLNGIASGAEVNQNTFSNIKVGSTTIEADSKTDTLELAGSNVTLTPDATNDKVTIGITKANVTAALGYTPPTTNTTYSAGTGLSLSSNSFSVKLGYTTSGNNRAVQADSNGNLYVVQKDDNTNTWRPVSDSISSTSSSDGASSKAVKTAYDHATNHVLASSTQPTTQTTGDIWLVLVSS